jgi:lycopene beta-cyclase
MICQRAALCGRGLAARRLTVTVAALLMMTALISTHVFGFSSSSIRVASIIKYNRMHRQAISRGLAHGLCMLGNEINVDVAVIGGGIAGSTISFLLQERQGCTVANIDPRINQVGSWYPNYGEWRDEWHALSDRLELPELRACTTTEWEITDCFFGGSYEIPVDERLTLQRPYVRVDRIKMQALLRERFVKAGGVSVPSKLSSTRIAPNLFDQNLMHNAEGSVLTLDNGDTVKCKLLIDASGLESKLVGKQDPVLARGVDKVLPTGFQIAYGFIAHVDQLGPYDGKAMTLFDYRTSHLDDKDSRWQREAADKPTVSVRATEA